MKTVEVQIQLQNIHAGFPEESQVAALRMSLDKRAHVFFFRTTRTSNARNLEFCSRRRDIRIQARPRRGYQVDWDGSIRILCLEILYISFYALQKILVGRSQE